MKRTLLVALSMSACGKDPNPASKSTEAGSASAHVAAASAVAAPLDLDALLPAGEGWKCVRGRCARHCVMPRIARGARPESQTNPPCLDRAKAFCAAHDGYGGASAYAACFETHERCESERASVTTRLGVATTRCEER